MNRLSRSIVALALSVCLVAPISQAAGGEELQSAKSLPSIGKDVPVEFLLDSAAKDFTSAPAPRPESVKKARIGRWQEGEGKPHFVLCGSFRPSGKSPKAEWIPFATIQTQGYEQWIGGQAATFCGAKTKWYAGDHSADLMARITARK